MLEELHASQAELFQAIDNAPRGSATEDELLAELRDLNDEIAEEVARAALSAAVADRDTGAKSKTGTAREHEESVETLGTARTDPAAAGSALPAAPIQAPGAPANSPYYPSSAPQSPGPSVRPLPAPVPLAWGLPVLAGIVTFLWPNNIAPEPVAQPTRDAERDAGPPSEPVPEPQPRRWGEEQLCTDAYLDELHDELHRHCESGGCSETRERRELGYTTRRAYREAIDAGLGWHCPEILERLGDAEDCLALRKAIDEDCFSVPRPGDSAQDYIDEFKGHQRQIESALYAVMTCEDLAEERGCF